MSQDVVSDYFAKVGRSYYRSKQFLGKRRNQGFDFQPISQFGIGVLSVFMVSDRLEVETKAVDNGEAPISITIDAAQLFWFRNGNRTEPGTTMRVKLRISSSEFLEKDTWKAKKRYKKEHGPTLLDTVKLVAPHLEFPVEVVEDGKTKDFIGEWMLPDPDHGYTDFIETIHLDFTKDGPRGLDGIACVFMLKEGCSFGSPLYKEKIEFNDGEDAEYICHSTRGTIETSQTTFNRHGDEIDSSWTDVVSSKGRWSQQGFGVPYPLFRDNSDWSFRHSQQAPKVHFPFPVHYDLNLHSSFVLPLSAERKNILPLSQATDVCGRLARVIAELIL
jgi:hypothetical protein